MPYADPVKDRAYHKAYGTTFAREQGQARQAAGLCRTCRTPVERFVHCLDCRKQRAEHYRITIRPALLKQGKRCIGVGTRACRARCVRPWATRCGKCSARYANAVRWGKVIS